MALTFGTDISIEQQILNVQLLDGVFNYVAYELSHEKTNVVVFDQVRHKPGCTATENSSRGLKFHI